MSEATNTRSKTSRFYLLTTVSSIALIWSGFGAGPAIAAGSDKDPSVWVELGISSDKVHESTDSFALPFGGGVPPGGMTGPLVGGLNLSRSPGEYGSLTFRPEGTDWVFSAAVTYGRSKGTGHLHQSRAIPTTSFVTYHVSIPATGFFTNESIQANPATNSIDADTISSEKHLILDFTAGKDVGIGSDSTSTIALGARLAQLDSNLDMPQYQAVQGIHFARAWHGTRIRHRYISGEFRSVFQYRSGNRELWRDLGGNNRSAHDFEGVGPSISWKNSLALSGRQDSGGEILLDFGVNAAVLFGKQKNKADHEAGDTYQCFAKGHYPYTNLCNGYPKQYAHVSHSASEKSVTVPNVGGFAGMSYRIRNFKASFGYKVDYFFRAIDTGIAGQHAVTRSFQGPYASISIGIGD